MEYPASFQSSGNRVFEKVGRVFFLGGRGGYLFILAFFIVGNNYFFSLFFLLLFILLGHDNSSLWKVFFSAFLFDFLNLEADLPFSPK